MEQAAAQVGSQVEAVQAEKRAALAALVQAERDALLWERRLQLEREMQVQQMRVYAVRSQRLWA